MSNMSELDIIRQEHKLSEAQMNALIEVSDSQVVFTAKKNTMDSLIKRGLVSYDEASGFSLTSAGQEIVQPNHSDVVKAPESVMETLEDLLGGDPWEFGEQIEETLVDVDTDLFRKMVKKHELQSQWRNSGVWDDLSLDEIKEDIKTGINVNAKGQPNREARRKHERILRNEFRKVFVVRPRKQIKITGKVGV